MTEISSSDIQSMSLSDDVVTIIFHHPIPNPSATSIYGEKPYTLEIKLYTDNMGDLSRVLIIPIHEFSFAYGYVEVHTMGPNGNIDISPLYGEQRYPFDE